ncbi:hypothetical protein [Luteolibacter sp. Populi]|uniref:hypothetical protein n=1 Tax=Luteolibacter sp. Populi TaxID=3230487 RepID=UPI0034657C50
MPSTRPTLTHPYMKKILFALGFSGLLLAPLFAEDYKIPKKDSVFSISFPEKWTVTHGDESVDAVTSDNAIQLYAQTDDADTLEESVTWAIDYLTKASVKIDADSQKDNEGKINGMKVGGLNWDGTDEDGACRVSLSFIELSDEKVITLLYWGSSAAEKEHAKELESILNSMKPLKATKPAKAKAEDKEEEGEEEEEKEEK